MTPLQARKLLLVAEADLQRRLLRKDFDQLVGCASAVRRRITSTASLIKAASSVFRFVGLFRRPSRPSSLVERLSEWAQTGWTLWRLWKRREVPSTPARRPETSTNDSIASALEALRQATANAR